MSARTSSRSKTIFKKRQKVPANALIIYLCFLLISLIGKEDEEGILPLHWAALNGRLEVCRYLITDCQVEVDALSGDQRAPALHWAACKGHVQVSSVFLEAGADWRLTDQQGYNSLHVAAQNGQDMIMRLILAQPGADVNSRDSAGRTPLLWASYRGHVEVVGMLLKFEGIELDAVDVDGRGPLHWAVIKGHSVVAARLLKAGASLNLTDSQGKKPSDWAKTKEISWFSRLEQITLDYRKNPCLATAKETPTESIGLRVLPMLLVPILLISYCKADSWWKGNLIGAGAVLALHLLIERVLLPPGKSLPETPYLASFNLGTLILLTIEGAGWLVSPKEKIWSATWVAGAVTALISLLSLRNKNPGTLSLPRSLERRNATIRQLAKEGLLNKRSFCTTCQIRKPLRSKHCQTCDRCVARFDHHCPWIHNCVGSHNHRTFVTYLLGCIVMAIAHAPLSFKYVTRGNEGIDNWKNVLKHASVEAPAIVWLGCFGVLSSVLIASLAGLQLYQALRNLTTNELSNYRRLEYFYLHEDGRFRNPFNLGFLSNFRDFWRHPMQRRHDYTRVFEVKLNSCKKGCCQQHPPSQGKLTKMEKSSSMASIQNVIEPNIPLLGSN